MRRRLSGTSPRRTCSTTDWEVGPSKRRPGRNSQDTIGRDLYGELARAVRRAGMRMGIFYEMEDYAGNCPMPGPGCGFALTSGTDPVLVVRAPNAGGVTARGAMKIHGRLIELTAEEAGGYASLIDGATLSAGGVTVQVAPLEETPPSEATETRQADMTLTLEQGLNAGFRGYYTCEAQGPGGT